MSCYSCIYHTRDEGEEHITCSNPDVSIERDLLKLDINYPWWFLPIRLNKYLTICKNYKKGKENEIFKESEEITETPS